MKSKKLPKELFITRENEGTADEFFNNHLSLKDSAAHGEKRLVGKYQLVSVLEVETEIKVTQR